MLLYKITITTPFDGIINIKTKHKNFTVLFNSRKVLWILQRGYNGTSRKEKINERKEKKMKGK